MPTALGQSSLGQLQLGYQGAPFYGIKVLNASGGLVLDSSGPQAVATVRGSSFLGSGNPQLVDASNAWVPVAGTSIAFSLPRAGTVMLQGMSNCHINNVDTFDIQTYITPALVGASVSDYGYYRIGPNANGEWHSVYLMPVFNLAAGSYTAQWYWSFNGTANSRLDIEGMSLDVIQMGA